jgi:L-seryl-tRNA(Ser) seleniumtransferase
VGNLRRFVAEGADAVIYSGGKAIGGPQATGIVAGRKELIESIALQQQDMDVYPQTWSQRRRYLESGVLAGPPHHGLGRGFKVGREEIAGLVVALKRYLARDHTADQMLWQETVEAMAAGLADLPHVSLEIYTDPNRPIPVLRLHLDEGGLGKTAYDVVNELAETEPAVAVSEGFAFRGVVGINPLALQPGESAVVVERLRATLG